MDDNTIVLTLSPQVQEFLARLAFFFFFHGVGLCMVLMSNFVCRFTRR